MLFGQRRHERRPVTVGARRDLLVGEVADGAEQVVEVVGVAHAPAAGRQPLQLELEIGERGGVDQLAQLLGAEQLAQQVAVERQRAGPALGERRVALVHVRRDPAEQQRLGER